MSVLVKGMKMPRDCYECKAWSQCFDEKPSFNMIKSVCPLVEVKEPHWIPCSEELPKEDGSYLVTLEYKYGAETTVRFFKIENGEPYWSVWGNENITAWMPKPEPFKGVTE